MSTVIKIENVSKQYRLGNIGTNTLKGDLQRWWYNIRGLPDPTLMIGQENSLSAGGTEEFVWALKDINLEVKQGEVLGIIGKNGAGKSTLLKLLSRVTAPTTGNIKVKGRIASLLEVGTGFHPELTGKENIYLNGAILGMTKTEIRNKFDEIVDFAGVAKYIDTPVKRYSSGMYVRLGFAVAAFLEPEILIVDEVLAVGDAEFQKKALGKMEDVSRNHGKTVLFVSHNMPSVKKLCKTSILLKNGSIMISGGVEDIVSFYMGDSYKENPGIFFNDLANSPGNENIRIKSFEVNTLIGNEINVESGLNFKLCFYNYKANTMLDTTFELSTIEDICVFHTGTMLTHEKNSKQGFYEVQFKIPPYTLNAGKYKMKLIFGENQRYVLWRDDNILNFEIENTLKGQGYNMATLPGILKPKFEFKYSFISE
jgi:lipopolysaccharide transport system ATP-binding protein